MTYKKEGFDKLLDGLTCVDCTENGRLGFVGVHYEDSTREASRCKFRVACIVCGISAPARGTREEAVLAYCNYISNPNRRFARLEKDVESLKEELRCARFAGNESRESAETFKQERDSLRAERDALLAQDEVNFSLWKKALCVVRESLEAIVSNKGVAAEDEAAEDEPKETTESTENTEGWGEVRLDKAIKAVVDGDEPKKKGVDNNFVCLSCGLDSLMVDLCVGLEMVCKPGVDFPGGRDEFIIDLKCPKCHAKYQFSFMPIRNENKQMLESKFLRNRSVE